MKTARPAPHDPSELSEDALIEGLINRDSTLGSVPCQRLMKVVDGTLYRVLGRGEVDHDDLVQAAFEQIVLSIYPANSPASVAS